MRGCPRNLPYLIPTNLSGTTEREIDEDGACTGQMNGNQSQHNAPITTHRAGSRVMQFMEQPHTGEFDSELLQRVLQVFYQTGYAPHRSLEIRVERSVVVVQGRLPTFYLRQIAVEWIKRVAGVTQVIDQIEVGDDPRQPKDYADHQRESLVIATQDCMDLPDLARAAHVVHRPQLCQRNRLSSVKG